MELTGVEFSVVIPAHSKGNPKMSTASVVKHWPVNFSNKLIGARNKWIIIHRFCVLVDEP